MTGELLDYLTDILLLPQGPEVSNLFITETDRFFCDKPMVDYL